MNGLAALEAEKFTPKCYDMSRFRHMALMTAPSSPIEFWLPFESSGIRADTLELTPFFPATIVKSMSQERNLAFSFPRGKFGRGHVEKSETFHGWRRCRICTLRKFAILTRRLASRSHPTR